MPRIRSAVLIGVLLGAHAASEPGAQGPSTGPSTELRTGSGQAYPVRPVRYIMPLPAGQETDVFARILARRLGEVLGQNVIVDNRPGGGTVIGTDLAAKAPPDGYTLVHVLTAHAINPTLHSK